MRMLEQEGQRQITSDHRESTMCIKCHVTARVTVDKSSGYVGRSKPVEKTVASLMKRQGEKRPQRRSRGILRIQRIKFQCVSLPLNYPPPHTHTQDGPALAYEKDTPLYTTLPLHMTVWWFTPLCPSVSFTPSVSFH